MFEEFHNVGRSDRIKSTGYYLNKKGGGLFL